MKSPLIIVESPSKIKTLQKFLDANYNVEASVGHFRDLPKSKLGIEVDDNFSAEYHVSPDSTKTVQALKKALKKSDALFIATDPDREGEAIAWHIVDELKPKVPTKRLVFNEITKTAILESFNHTRDIDINLVDAQETRRFLDRLFGFMVSEKMWFNMKSGVSAGRVQSPAIKILVDREKERTKFKQNEYWSISGIFESNKSEINAKLIKIGDKKLATGNAFDKKTGTLFNADDIVLNEKKSDELIKEIKNNSWAVDKLEQKPVTQRPYAPFITSTLQQEGIRQFRMSAQNVMRIAQTLYENGYITLISINKNLESYEGIYVELVNFKTKTPIKNKDLQCKNIDEIIDLNKTIFKEYEYSKLNNNIKNNLKSVNDYIIFNQNGEYNYIVLCELNYDEKLLKNINFNKNINSLVNKIQLQFLQKYKNEYKFRYNE